MNFDDFVSARLPAILRYATVLTWDRHLAQDLTQETLARAQLRWAHISRLDAPERYVKRMVLNRLLSWRRYTARQVPLPTERLAAFTAPVPDPTGAHDERDAMRRLIVALPLRQRTVIALRFY